MTDLTASKKKTKALLWEEAKRKEEEEAKNRLMKFRLQEAEELARANLSGEAISKPPEKAFSSASEPGKKDESPAVEKKEPKEEAKPAQTDSAPPSAPVSVRAPAPASDVSRLEDQVRELRREVEEIRNAKDELELKNRRLARDLQDALDRVDAESKARTAAEREAARLKEELKDARAAASTAAAAPAPAPTPASAPAPAPADAPATLAPPHISTHSASSPVVLVSTPPPAIAVTEEDEGAEGDSTDASRLSNLTTGRAAPAGKRKPPTTRRAASTYVESSPKRDTPAAGSGVSLLSEAAAAQKEAKAQADRERALARQKEIAGGPRQADLAHMAASSPSLLRSSTDERPRSQSPSPFGDKVRPAIAQEDRLIMLKGRKRIRAKQVAMVRDSLNSGDVFILETKTKIFHWNGKKSSRPERTKGVDISHRLNRTYGSRLEIVQMDEGKSDDEPDFWNALGGKGPVKDEAACGDDGDFEKEEDDRNKLYRVTDKAETVLVSKDGALKREDLASDGIFILDCGNEFYLWYGKKSDNNQRRDAMQNVHELFSKYPRPDWTEVKKILEDGETPLFQEKFANWPDSFEKVMAKSGGVSNVATSKAGTKPDASKMHQEIIRSEIRLVDDGTGTVEIWSVDKVKRGAEATKTALPTSSYGQFFSKNSYIVLYTYGTSDSKSFILYFWQGRDCGVNEKAAAAGLVLKMQEQYKGATQIRVSQQKEPAHFLLAFKGNVIIHQGDLSEPEKAYADGASVLYQLKGTKPENSRTVQAQALASQLNSNSCFILQNSDQQWVWLGQHATEYEKTKVKEVAAILQGIRKMNPTISEGGETDDFWKALGGMAEYSTYFPHRVRFFQGDNARGFFTADEVLDFTEDDLDTAQMAIVDAYTEVFVWAGNESREADKKICLELGVDYVKAAKDGRGADTQVLLVYEFSEPLKFTRHFQAWQPRKTAAKKKDESSPMPERRATLKAEDVLTAAADLTFPLDQLRAKKNLPPNVDMGKLEMYLSTEDFQKTFNMTKDEFAALPAWKKLSLRKGAHLF